MTTILKIADIREKLTPIFAKNNIKKATIFGSYAKNMAMEKTLKKIRMYCVEIKISVSPIRYDDFMMPVKFERLSWQMILA